MTKTSSFAPFYANHTCMSFAEKLIDMIFPPRCIASGEFVDTQGMLSSGAFRRLNFIADPSCRRCGFPFDFDSTITGAQDSVCLYCQKSPPVYACARSALIYDDASRDMILGFKHGDQTHGVVTFVPWMMRAGKDILEASDLLMPVPLHRGRLFKRRYNQAALLAQALSRASHIPVDVDSLIRKRATVTQGHLNTQERQSNVHNAFAVTRPDAIRRKTITLVDDVLTTGATVSECTKALLKNGALSVNILSLARVVRPQRG